MPSLSVRRIDEDTYEQLRIRAAKNGVSIEEEVRRIIRRSVGAPDRLGQLAIQCFGERDGIELELPRRPPGEPIDFGE